MASKSLEPSALYRACRLDDSGFDSTADLEPLDEIMGQPRAVEAIRLGIEMGGDGYNVFALGTPGTGKRTLIRQFLEQLAPKGNVPRDWCYVNNFDEPDKPYAIDLPAGVAAEFSYDIDQLIEDVRTVLPKAFESDEFRERRQALQEETFQHEQARLQEIGSEAESRGLSIIWSPGGVMFSPLRDGKPMPPEEIEKLPEEERDRLSAIAEELQAKIVEVMRRTPGLYREARRKLEGLNEEIARQAFEPLIQDLRGKYGENPKAVDHLEAIQRHLMEHAATLVQMQQAQEADPAAQGDAMMLNVQTALFRGYSTNVFVTHDEDGGAPVIYEENPTYDNLLGRVEYISQMGTLITDFNLIKPGSLHRANGGYLIVDAHRLLSNPFAYEGLKRALRTRQVRIESATSSLGVFSTVSLEPEPIPLDVKVILLGTPMMYYLLQDYDPDFPELVKVPADFADDMDRDDESETTYARLIADQIRRHELLPFERGAVERVIEYSSIIASDSRKLSMRIRTLSGVLRESSYWAQRSDRTITTADDVQRAIEANRFRTNRIQERIRESAVRGILLIDTDGERVGQINGLSVFQFGESRFGQPNRITARVAMGDGGVIDIEREVELGGPTHSKGVLILQGFLRGRFARTQPIGLSASLVFEQSYGGVDGDSASCAELVALLSAIGDVPIKQSMAVTGSINQHGEVQAIGGVNEKIEGYFDLCNDRGLSGSQGVVIPRANVQHLMLRRDIVEAVEAGTFVVHSVETVDDVVELLTGLDAGVPDADGAYAAGSVNGRVAANLAEAAALKKKFASERGAED